MRRRVHLAIAIAITSMLCAPALARWKPEYGKAGPEVQAWFKNQHNEQGQWCCDESDGHPFFGDYKINEDGSVTIHDGDNPHQLPAYMVLKGGNAPLTNSVSCSPLYGARGRRILKNIRIGVEDR